jgi:aminopeptidase N
VVERACGSTRRSPRSWSSPRSTTSARLAALVGVHDERAAAFAVDALESTRPIEFPVVSPEDAEGMFDVLTYQKGASVLRMLEQYLGTDRFRAGIRLYLSARAYGNAETTDLWDAIEDATGDPVRRIMDSWIFQGGYPLIGVQAEGTRSRSPSGGSASPAPRSRRRRSTPATRRGPCRSSCRPATGSRPRCCSRGTTTTGDPSPAPPTTSS